MVETNVNKIVAELTRWCETKIGVVAIDIVEGLTEATPVFTGLASSSWVASVGEPNTYRPDIDFSSEVDRTLEVSPAMRRQEQGFRELNDYKLSQGDVYVTNSVPYIGALNHGTSRKAPAGFVEATIQIAVNKSGV